ncbi:MAG: T9SS type A sorting domain-containing protein [Saprospiraceae bacterium]|nr:T9SS type A sorting domain-containing protein [Saprospiraceae bacterium]MBK8854782.1 T9SS type A sorting domain-containing protein [Saprospiraceae bacterium]MBK9044257.1 T9SS type A sorting domain-containing protein [Saprospiraceae bacterium]
MKSRFSSFLNMVSVIVLLQLFSINTKANYSFVLNCPPNKYITCTDDLYNLSRFGNATYTLGYMTFSAGMPVVTYYLNSCHSGYITRTWSVEDPYWNWQTCTQTIYVSASPNNQLHINWPPDYEVEGCHPNIKPQDLPAPYNSPTWSGDECRMIGKSYTDMVFTVNNGCKKIMRTWKLIDWCDNNGWGTQWTHNQIIKIINEERPQFECVKEVTANAFNCKNARVNVPPLEVGPTSCGGSAVISNNSPYADNKGSDISGTYPIGTTKVVYTIQYGCGSRTFCSINVIVKNASAPTPYCLHGITTTLMPVDTNADGTIDDGMVDIWAKDLDRGSKSLCNYYPLRFSFSENPTDMFRTFTCAELGNNGVMMFVTDSKGGQSACMVNVVIQNNSANIPDCKRKEENIPDTNQLSSLTGRVVTPFGQVLQNAEITMDFDKPTETYITKSDTVEITKKDSFINASGYLLYFFKKEKVITTKTDTIREFFSLSEKTDSTGFYRFKDVQKDKDKFSLKAAYIEDRRKGIDSKDVELLTSYLLGEKDFTEPYQFLAADVDGNKKVDLADLNLLINFVTHTITDLTENQWFFTDASKTFSNPSDIFNHDFTNITSLDSLKGYKDTVSVMAIKVGNISNETSLVPQNTVVENRSSDNNLPVVNVYPNPSAGGFEVKLEGIKQFPVTMSLYDAKGELIMLKQFSSNGIHHQFSNEIQNIKAGLYMYKIDSHKFVTTGKWIKL